MMLLKYEMTDDKMTDSVSEHQNVNSGLHDSSNATYNISKIFFDDSLSVGNK